MSWLGELAKVWHYLVAALTLLMAILASGHALLFKRDSRATTLWVGLIWFAPLVGATLYFVAGVNRVKRKAVLLRGAMERYQTGTEVLPCGPEELKRHFPGNETLGGLARVVDQVSGRALLPGNRLLPLVGGDAAY
ncbi:MAG TPA: PLD nuclease N-terminal domain-containing protein, partial [Verrucomicrobiae bacterium]|nr:PLD nuclease N-terminal domain-containing protein [Verrucomicrobiae bacterium]